MAAIREKNYRVMRVLHEFGLRVEGGRDPGDSPVSFALQYNDPKLLEEILSWKNVEIDFQATDLQGRNLFHMIAINKDEAAFEAINNRAKSRLHRSQIQQLLNSTHDASQPYLTPLYYCQPSKELARKYIAAGAEAGSLSFLHCYFTLRPNFDYLSFLIKEVRLDIEESDVNDLTALGLVYRDGAEQKQL